MDELISPFCQVAGEVAAKADDTPVFSVIDPVKRILMGQGHLWMERTDAVLLKCSLVLLRLKATQLELLGMIR